MDSLKIAFYSDTYLPAIDGVVTSIINFKDELERRGHEVYIFASGDRSSKKRYSSKSVFIAQGVTFKPYPQYKLALFPYGSIIKVSRLRIDLVHAQTPFNMGISAMMTSKITRKPLVGSYHTMINNKAIVDNYYPKNPRLKRIANRSVKEYTRMFYNLCDAAVAPSDAIYKHLVKTGVDPSKISVVPNSVDLKRFNPKVDGSKVRKSLNIKGREKLVLYVGRTSMEKKLETMLHAAKYLSKRRDDLRFVVCGNGPAFDYYKNAAARLGLTNVTFTGFVTGAKLAEYYAASDLLCLPSTFETQGLVALEAMACAKPVVGADYLALSGLIKNGKNGEKFKPGDYISCSRKIEKVLNNTELYTQNTVVTAKEFSLEKVTDKMLDVYNLVLSKN